MKKKGTEVDPIDLEESVEEEKNVTDKMKEDARNRAIIEQAKITGSRHEICLAAAKTMVPGTKEVKNRRVGKVIIKHFLDALNIKIQCDHFKPRREADYSQESAEPNPCEFVLYGVDFLSTKMIVDRFKLAESLLERVVWVDDSNCKLIFNDEKSARMMLESQLKYPDTLKTKIEEDVDALPRGWFLLKPYELYTYQRNLYMRYATTLETNMQKDISNHYDKFVRIQETLYPKLLDQFDAKEKYLTIMEEIESEKNLAKRYERSRSRNDRKSQFYGEEGGYNRRNIENGGRSSRRRNDGRPGSFHVRQINKVRYEHQPATSRWQPNSYHDQGMSFRVNESIRQNNPNPNLSFVYFDREDQNNHGNLSFQMRNSLNLSHQDYDRKRQEAENLNCSMKEKSILVDEGLDNLSFIYAEKERRENDLNLSVNFEKVHNNSANDFDLNCSLVQSKDVEEKPKDLNELAAFFEVSEISPIIQANPLDCSFPVEEKPIIKPVPVPADLQFNNYRKPEKKKLEIDVLSDYSY